MFRPFLYAPAASPRSPNGRPKEPQIHIFLAFTCLLPHQRSFDRFWGWQTAALAGVKKWELFEAFGHAGLLRAAPARRPQDSGLDEQAEQIRNYL